MRRLPTGEDFSPSLLLRSPHLQSALASAAWRARFLQKNSGTLPARTRVCLLDCGEDVKLEAHVALPESDVPGCPMVVLLHGWEGSAESTYIWSMARHLDSRGYATVRLNFRDHGRTHHLNPGIFHSCRLMEVVQAVKAVASNHARRPMFIVGFSLGANFALRVALHAPRHRIALQHVVAVSPVIDPAHGLIALERAPWPYRRRFLSKWRDSLRRKQELFPQRYDLRECLRLTGLRETMRYLVERFSRFDTLEDYLDGYSVAGSRLAALRVPTTIISAADDPILSADDLDRIVPSPALRIEVPRYGGHCGFLETLTLRSWIDHRVERILDSAVASFRTGEDPPACTRMGLHGPT